MRVNVIPINELSEDLKQQWLRTQTANPALRGPCFHPELFSAVGQFIPDIYVALLSNDNQVSGFLPFLKDRSSATAQIIEFCDYQAIIGPPSHPWDIDLLLRKASLKAWNVRALIDFAGIKSEKEDFVNGAGSRVDLTEGFDKYQASLQHSFMGDRERRQLRALERTFGPIRFISICNDAKVQQELIRWKILRHGRDLYWEKLATQLQEYFLDPRLNGITGILSALYAGDSLVGATFGIKYQDILHGWMIGFDPAFSKYSPGTFLLYYLFCESQTIHYRILDFGPGKGEYKRHFANSALPFIRGTFRLKTFTEKVKTGKWFPFKI